MVATHETSAHSPSGHLQALDELLDLPYFYVAIRRGFLAVGGHFAEDDGGLGINITRWRWRTDGRTDGRDGRPAAVLQKRRRRRRRSHARAHTRHTHTLRTIARYGRRWERSLLILFHARTHTHIRRLLWYSRTRGRIIAYPRRVAWFRPSK